MNNLVALLPMKGHSERVPNKNMKNFNGKPLYHTIMQRLEDSFLVKKIIINTDSEIIAADAVKCFSKVQILMRPEKLQGDFVSMNEIIHYDLSQVDDFYFLQTHSTNPLLKTETINNAINSFFANVEKFDSLFSVTKLQTRLYWKDGSAVNHNPNELIRTQDLPPLFEENSNFYIFSKESFRNSGNKRIGIKPQMFEMNKLESVDIDTPEDFLLAEMLYKTLNL